MRNLDVDKVVRNFQNFLKVSWNNIKCAEKDYIWHDDLINEWSQANWELMVESLICEPGEFLEIYNCGADFNSPSSRVWMTDKEPTHVVYARPNSTNEIKDFLSGNFISGIEEMDFEFFATFSNNWYAMEPPFDFILLEQREEFYLVSVSHINFACKPIEN